MDRRQIRYYLEVWGDWREKGVPGLGWPSMTSEAKLLHSPGRSTKPKIGPLYESNHVARTVQNAIDQIDHELQNVLWFRYVAKIDRSRAAEAFGRTTNEWDWMLTKAHNCLGRTFKL